MKSKSVEILIKKEYRGKRLISRWKTTTIKWKQDGMNVTHTHQDKNNFYLVDFYETNTD